MTAFRLIVCSILIFVLSSESWSQKDTLHYSNGNVQAGEIKHKDMYWLKFIPEDSNGEVIKVYTRELDYLVKANGRKYDYTSRPGQKSVPDSVERDGRIRRASFGFTLFGPTGILSADAGYYLTPKWEVQAGAGILGVHAGSIVHLAEFGKKRTLNLYSGLHYSLFNLDGFKYSDFEYEFFYLPIGIRNFKNNDTFVSFEGAAMFTRDGDVLPFLAIKSAWRF